MVQGGSTQTTSAQNAPGASSESDRLEEAMADLEDSEFYRQPRFACGRLFISSVVTSLVVNTMYNPSLAMLIHEMISAHYVLVTVPAEWKGQSFFKFFEHLLRDR